MATEPSGLQGGFMLTLNRRLCAVFFVHALLTRSSLSQTVATLLTGSLSSRIALAFMGIGTGSWSLIQRFRFMPSQESKRSL
jgi:hypothetical protein